MAQQNTNMSPPNGGNELPMWIRSYVHYDNMANNYVKQANGARKLRDEFESKIIQNLVTNRMENAVIQISGAQLQCAEEKRMPSMSMPRLEQYLRKYYAQKGAGVDETEAILRFIKLQKQNDIQVTKCLKKTAIPTAIPPPPPLQGGNLLGPK
jgi:hypothetical protein